MMCCERGSCRQHKNLWRPTHLSMGQSYARSQRVIGEEQQGVWLLDHRTLSRVCIYTLVSSLCDSDSVLVVRGMTYHASCSPVSVFHSPCSVPQYVSAVSLPPSFFRYFPHSLSHLPCFCLHSALSLFSFVSSSAFFTSSLLSHILPALHLTFRF